MCVAGDNSAWRCNPKESLVFSLRGNKWCIKGCDCGHKVRVSTVFGLDCWTRQKGELTTREMMWEQGRHTCKEAVCLAMWAQGGAHDIVWWQVGDPRIFNMELWYILVRRGDDGQARQ